MSQAPLPDPAGQAPISQPMPKVAPLVAVPAPRIRSDRHVRLRYWAASIWLSLMLLISWGAIAIWIVLMLGSSWSASSLGQAATRLFAVVAPLSPVLAILLWDRATRRLTRFAGSLRKPKRMLAVTVIAAIVVGVITTHVLTVLLNFSCTTEVINAAAHGSQWKLSTLDEDFRRFGEGRMCKSRNVAVYRAFVFSLAARQASDGQYPEQEQLLLSATGAGKPIELRIVGHLGLANFGKAANSPADAITHLKEAASLSNTFAPKRLHVSVLKESGFLNLKLSRQAPDEKTRFTRLEQAKAAYTELLSIVTNEMDRASIRTNRASASALAGDWNGAIKDWRDVVAELTPLAAKKPGSTMYAPLLGDAHNNIAVGCMVLSLWDEAWTGLKESEKYTGGDDRRTQLNQLIVLVRRNKRDEAAKIADRLEPHTERAADHALFGLAYADGRRFVQYAKALHLSQLQPKQLNDSVASQLAQLCNQEYLGLTFDKSDFLK